MKTNGNGYINVPSDINEFRQWAASLPELDVEFVTDDSNDK